MEKKMSACRFSQQGINPLTPNPYSLDSVHFGGPQQSTPTPTAGATVGINKHQMQRAQPQAQAYYMNEVNATAAAASGQHYPVLPPAFNYGGQAGGAAAGHQVMNAGYGDLMAGGHSVAAAAAARSCALPSPTIYPPTPPPSAPWVHPWFLGDTF